MKRPAAFLDRDGTIVTDSGFLRDPDAIEMLPGAAEALIRLRSAGFLIILVTNQSGIARGIFDWNAYRAVAAAIERRLDQAGARIDATYVCPHHPSVSGPCDCRKPGLASYQDAARRFDLDLSRSVWIGDRPTDLEPARALGGRAVLVETGEGHRHRDEVRAAGFPVAADLGAAVALLLDDRGLY